MSRCPHATAPAPASAPAPDDAGEVGGAHEVTLVREFTTATSEGDGPRITVSTSGAFYTELALSWRDDALPDLEITRVDATYRRPRAVRFLLGGGGVRELIAALTALADAADAEAARGGAG